MQLPKKGIDGVNKTLPGGSLEFTKVFRIISNRHNNATKIIGDSSWNGKKN